MFTGVDHHERFSVTTMMDGTGRIIDRQKIKKRCRLVARLCGIASGEPRDRP